MPENRKPTILIVDDLPENRLALQSLLAQLPARIVSVGSAQAALDTLLHEDVAVALLDVQMPEENGFELAELMRGAERTRSVPIIFVTAGASDSSWEFRGYDIGAIDFLFKPLDPRVVLSKVRVLLDMSEQRRELERQVRIAEGARKQAEFLNEKLEAETVLRDRFVAALSHDLRTPLTASRLAAQLIEMQKDRSGPAVEKYAQKVIKNMDRADRMITDLLDVSRIEAGKPIPLQLETVELDPFLAKLGEDLRMMYGARVQVESATGAKGVWSDEALRRLIENFVSNAIKYGHHSAPITVKAEKQGEGIQIVVHNDGNPIPEEDQRRLFDRFHRARAAEQSGKRGWGIGLAVCRGIVGALGGQLRVKSDAASGTDFIVELPLNSRRIQERVASSGHASDRILVVDDVEATRYTLRRLLEREKYQVFEAASGTDAIVVAKAERPGVIILNVNLADMSGHDVCRQIRGEPELSKACIIQTSASSVSRAELEAGLNAGADEYLAQPVDPAELLKKVATFFQPSPRSGADSPGSLGDSLGASAI